MPLQATSGAASYDAFGGGVPAVPNYIEEVFSTYLYTGNSSTQTITNGIDLAGKGGLTWIKQRNGTAYHSLFDTVRGAGNPLFSNTTNAQDTDGAFTAFTSTGFSLGTYFGGGGFVNTSGSTYASWTFREQPKFFDVVTYYGNGTSNTQIAHNLGSVPGCIIVKNLDSNIYTWAVYHRSLGATDSMTLNSSEATATTSNTWYDTDPTSTVFTLGNSTRVNQSGKRFVAYLFAHNAGGFGQTGTDNVISCGTFTTDGSSNATITLGYEPQWVLTKRTDGGGGAWGLYDTMRGWSYSAQNYLLPNTDDAEGTINSTNFKPTATGFTIGSPYDSSATYIYIAIRRGPMKVPTDATKVFYPSTQTGVNNSTGQFITTGFPPDLSIEAINDATSGTKWTIDRLRGNTQFIGTNTTAAESNVSPYGINFTTSNVGVQNVDYGTTVNAYVNWLFRRAPSFFDEVCWTGTGSGSQAITHNLNAVPEFTITKRRSGTGNWSCFPVMFGVNTGIYLDSTAALQTNAALHPTLPTSTTYYTNDASWGDENIGGTFVTYLFSTCAGVSKVGSYTGNGSTQTINCGFTGGARFVLIKRTDSTGDWYVYDTARGMTVLTDPYSSLNNGGGPTATLGSVTTVSTGFAVNASVLAAINTNAASYIFLAIA